MSTLQRLAAISASFPGRLFCVGISYVFITQLQKIASNTPQRMMSDLRVQALLHSGGNSSAAL